MSEDGDEIYQDTIVFRDAQGQLQETTSGSYCTNDFANGEMHPLWCLPGLPGAALIGGPGGRFYIISAFYLPLFVACLVCLFLRTRELMRACIRAERFGRLWQGGLACLVMVIPILVLAHFFPPSPDQGHRGPSHNFHAGEAVAVSGPWVVTVQGEHLAWTGGPRAAEVAGTICLEVDVTLRNATNQSQTLAVNQFALFDGQAKVLEASCSIDAPRLKDTQVPPGAR